MLLQLPLQLLVVLLLMRLVVVVKLLRPIELSYDLSRNNGMSSGKSDERVL
jgi:hypothetical protein